MLLTMRKNLEESYIILNDISIEKAQDIVMQLNEKYFKITTGTNYSNTC